MSGDGDTGSLDDLHRVALDLASGFSRQPRLLRVRAGEFAVEVEWPEAGGGAATGDGPAGTVAGGAAGGGAVGAAGGGAVGAAPGGTSGTAVVAPTVGVFYRAPQPGAPPFVSEGDTVVAGTQVGIVEAMKLMIPVEADRQGLVVEFVAADGDAVEYGTPLVLIEAG